MIARAKKQPDGAGVDIRSRHYRCDPLVGRRLSYWEIEDWVEAVCSNPERAWGMRDTQAGDLGMTYLFTRTEGL